MLRRLNIQKARPHPPDVGQLFFKRKNVYKLVRIRPTKVHLGCLGADNGIWTSVYAACGVKVKGDNMNDKPLISLKAAQRELDQLTRELEVAKLKVDYYTNGPFTIQYRLLDSLEWGDLLNEPTWYPCYAYRRKPEPAIRPWTAKEAIGKTVTRKADPEYFWIIRFAGPLVACVDTNDVYLLYDELLKDYTQLDGSPCGVVE